MTIFLCIRFMKLTLHIRRHNNRHHHHLCRISCRTRLPLLALLPPFFLFVEIRFKKRSTHDEEVETRWFQRKKGKRKISRTTRITISIMYNVQCRTKITVVVVNWSRSQEKRIPISNLKTCWRRPWWVEVECMMISTMTIVVAMQWQFKK